MSRRIELTRALTAALSQALIPELIAIVQSYMRIPDVLFVIGGLQHGIRPIASVERITVRDPSDAAPSADDRVECAPEPKIFLIHGLERACATAVGRSGIFLFGGYRSDKEHSHRSVLYADPFIGDGGWTECSRFGSIVGAAVMVVGSVVYLFGGRFKQKTVNFAWKYDTGNALTAKRDAAGGGGGGDIDLTAGWIQLPTRMANVKGGCDACLTPDGGTIYVSGDDKEGQFSEPVDVFDVKTETFRPNLEHPYPTPPGAAIAYFLDSIWLIGGLPVTERMAYDDSDRDVSVAQRYRVVATASAAAGARGALQRWETDSHLQTARMNCRAAVVNGGKLLLVVGGRDNADEDERTKDSIEVYDPQRRVWVEQKAVLSAGRYHFAMAHCYE